MRKTIWLALVLVLLFGAAGAAAQTTPTIDRLVVQLWPEYDRPEMLVIYDFVLAGSGDQPVKTTVQIPLDAELIAVARDVDGSLVVEIYDAQVNGNYQDVTLDAIPGVVYHIEYYDALARQGKQRHYTYTWTGLYPVNSLSLNVLAPSNAVGWQFTPNLAMGMSHDGTTPIYGGDFGPLPAGMPFTLDVDYSRDDDALAVNPTVTPAPAVPPSLAERLQSGLPYVLGGIGVLFLLAGAWLYLRPQDGLKSAPKSAQKKNAGKSRQKSGDVRYCPQCGKRAEPGDRFCRACGSRLRD